MKYETINMTKNGQAKRWNRSLALGALVFIQVP